MFCITILFCVCLVGPGPSSSSSTKTGYPGAPCWSCDKIFDPANELFCNQCEKLQPLMHEQTYFELLGLKPSFFVDKELLERNFQALQKKIHPDKFVGKTSKEQKFAMARSSAASEAYQVMKDPIARAKYVLAMYGVELESEVLQDHALLMEIMEEQESLTEREWTKEELKNKSEEFAKKVTSSLKEAEQLLQSHGKEALKPMTHLIVKAQYYMKLSNDALTL